MNNDQPRPNPHTRERLIDAIEAANDELIGAFEPMNESIEALDTIAPATREVFDCLQRAQVILGEVDYTRNENAEKIGADAPSSADSDDIDTLR